MGDVTVQPEWSPARAFYRALLALLLKIPVCFLIWIIFLVIIDRPATWLATHITGRGLPGIAILVTAVVAIPAWPIGQLLSRGLTDRLGFDGAVPAGLGIGAVWLAILVGTKVFPLVGGSSSWVLTLATMGVAIEASLIVLWRTWLSPD